MTFVPSFLSGAKNLNTSKWYYTYVYLIGSNGIWVVIPLILLYQAGKNLSRIIHQKMD